MSMNLHCNKLDLWQTPTYITYMCMEAKGPVAQLNAYKHWVRNQNIHIMRTKQEEESHNQQLLRIQEHIKEVEAVQKESNLDVYIL